MLVPPNPFLNTYHLMIQLAPFAGSLLSFPGCKGDSESRRRHRFLLLSVKSCEELAGSVAEQRCVCRAQPALGACQYRCPLSTWLTEEAPTGKEKWGASARNFRRGGKGLLCAMTYNAIFIFIFLNAFYIHFKNKVPPFPVKALSTISVSASWTSVSQTSKTAT